mmetsp:Transcript_13809/g.13761  ORF Transcript_13809/g.13761 Transcript_13809/m.13761 type:complete len:96 (+) Transcript_13809:914-1201(+)|eukprot:CAMPEP_0196995466 /NCGR_PEP_ID=MMETSP1380-20130617/1568_1 /TAXON_ID=5936 /ORGANISM="Euplotes crassus, Strain CT5" /LENGTH=95 /DNA_ID=CAMNT_0042411135 /DNA_START=890 /DNA_END=1177 /DNA_ORIENTATION=+
MKPPIERGIKLSSSSPALVLDNPDSLGSPKYKDSTKDETAEKSSVQKTATTYFEEVDLASKAKILELCNGDDFKAEMALFINDNNLEKAINYLQS